MINAISFKDSEFKVPADFILLSVAGVLKNKNVCDDDLSEKYDL